MQLHERLDGVQKQFGLSLGSATLDLELRPESSPDIDPLHFETTVLDRIPVRSRAGLFAYFNALVSSKTPRSACATDDGSFVADR